MQVKQFKDYKNNKDEVFVESAISANVISEDFKPTDLIKVGTLITKMATKRIGAGSFSYVLTEKFSKQNGQKGIGALFVSDKGVMMRFNFLSNTKKGFSVNSIDYWKGRKIGEAPKSSIIFAGQNIVEVTDQLFDFLGKGILEEGTYKSFDELSESTAEDRKLGRLKFAQEHGIKISYAGTAHGLRKKALKMGLQSDYDNEFGGFIEVSNDVQETTSTKTAYEADQKILEGDKVFADPKFVFTDMEEAAKVVARGGWRSLIIAGDGGLGKTYGVKEVLTSELGPYAEGPRGKWMFYEGLSTTGFGLFKILLLNKDKLIVFDDSDAIWKNTDMTNMMKIVTSDSGDRSISWASNATANVSLMSREQREEYELEYIQELMDDPNTKMKAPSMFNFTGSMINISNMPADKFDNAIKSRAIFINLFLAQRDVLRRMATIKKLQGASDEKIKMLLNALDPDAADALEGKGKYAGEVKYITPEIARKSKKMNMRSMDIAEALYDAGVKNFEHMVGLYA